MDIFVGARLRPEPEQRKTLDPFTWKHEREGVGEYRK